ncbi:MAG: hypothetical protein WBX81_08880 [Nitrososphaeraceae archaeon]
MLDGLDITKVLVHLQRIGITFQNPSLFPNRNSYENIVFGLSKKAKEELCCDGKATITNFSSNSMRALVLQKKGYSF